MFRFMAQETSTDVLRNSRDVGVSVPRAFEVFTVGLGTWWIPEFTWSGPDALDMIGIEPGVDGKCYEIGPYGFRCDWGRVTVWEPPNRLAFTWQIGPDRVPQPDPAKASEVEVLFHPEGEARTRVELEHRGFERHGEAGAGYREALEAGWDQLLARYAAAAG
jgi:uncharacterized protein YndB with AHSA1/START domain